MNIMNIKNQKHKLEIVNSYLKCIRIIKKRSLNQVSEKVFISKSQLNRIELGGSSVTEKDLNNLLNYYNISNDLIYDEKVIQQVDILIKLILENNMNCLEEIKQIVVDLTQYNNLCLPYLYFLKFLQKFYILERDEELLELGYFLTKLISLFKVEYQAVFYCLFGYTFIYLKDYVNGEKYILQAFDLNHNNELLKGVLCQYMMSINNYNGKYHENIELYEKAITIFNRLKCIDRQVKVKALLANTYSRIGNCLKALEINKEIIEMKDEISRSSYYVSIYNIGYEYKRLERYDEAVKFYIQALEYFKDQETCFEIAWCFYKMNNFKQAKIYLEKSNLANKTGQYFEYFCDWLNEMIDHAYNLQCLKILKRIEKKYGDSMGLESKEFLYLQLVECLEHRKNEKEALMYAKKLISLYNLKW